MQAPLPWGHWGGRNWQFGTARRLAERRGGLGQGGLEGLHNLREVKVNQTIELFARLRAVCPLPTYLNRPIRQDGEQSRERLIRAALALFAQHGFAQTSTRDIAQAAQTNIAAISYYFGDKAGLYRAAFFEGQGSPRDEINRFSDPALNLAEALKAFYAGFLEPLRQGAQARQCMKLHAREMIEPTGLWEEEIATGIRPMHDALVAVLCRHYGVAQADDDLQRLAVCLAGLGVHMHVGCEVTDAIAPGLNGQPDSLDLWIDRLVMYALAMAHAEQQRRQADLLPTPTPTPTASKRPAKGPKP
jgi:TetR/AcrR family transcriptional regulator, regulator of cefoperazone and chloramphenicol sensitivity